MKKVFLLLVSILCVAVYAQSAQLTNCFGERALTQNGPATVMAEIYTTKNGKTTRKLQTIQLGAVKEDQSLAMLTID